MFTGSYTITRTLPHTYKNIIYVKAAMSTFISNASSFGYNVTAFANADPATQISINLTMYTAASFSQIGFSVILICDGF